MRLPYTIYICKSKAEIIFYQFGLFLHTIYPIKNKKIPDMAYILFQDFYMDLYKKT